jgi:hypothetical protein
MALLSFPQSERRPIWRRVCKRWPNPTLSSLLTARERSREVHFATTTLA